MIIIKKLKGESNFILSDSDIEIVEKLCYRLESLYLKESEEMD